MAQECVHKGCGKLFDQPDESECVYHPGPPIFHEGQKGWECCKPRVLDFDDFMSIPPCTRGPHSAVDDTPAPKSKTKDLDTSAGLVSGKSEPAAAAAAQPPLPRLPTHSQPAQNVPKASAPPQDESDDPDTQAPANATCKRRGCNALYTGGDRSEELCVHHPGQALFHEGSKGWTCCKRRVLEFDAFLKIEGCKSKTRHCFVGKKEGHQDEEVESVRHDFYQTPSTVIVSLFLKKIDKGSSTVTFSSPTTIHLDLRTADRKHYAKALSLYAAIDTEKSTFKILGTKLEFNLVKADGASWPVLRSDDKLVGEIIQMGRAGRA